MSNAATPLALSDAQRDVLESLSRSVTAQYRLVQRARVLLLAADGVSNVEIADVVGVSRPTVLSWRSGFAAEGLSWLGAPGVLTASVEFRVLRDRVALRGLFGGGVENRGDSMAPGGPSSGDRGAGKG